MKNSSIHNFVSAFLDAYTPEGADTAQLPYADVNTTLAAVRDALRTHYRGCKSLAGGMRWARHLVETRAAVLAYHSPASILSPMGLAVVAMRAMHGFNAKPATLSADYLQPWAREAVAATMIDQPWFVSAEIAYAGNMVLSARYSQIIGSRTVAVFSLDQQMAVVRWVESVYLDWLSPDAMAQHYGYTAAEIKLLLAVGRDANVFLAAQ